jgi:spore maturation protein CgeB
VKLVVFGLSVSSSWGNGHATLWRGLARALGEAGVRFVFFERDVPYYAQHRDEHDPRWGTLHLYDEVATLRTLAERELADADVGIVTSYCPDAELATELVAGSRVAAKVFYDLDTPVTLAALERGESVPYVPRHGLALFDLCLTFTGGPALTALRDRLGARRVAPLYGSVDPTHYRPTDPVPSMRGDLSYLGTFAADRQEALAELFLEPARRSPHARMILGGAQYPSDFAWQPNVHFLRHVPPELHPAFYCSSRLTLNVTRAAMVRMGFCPSGRLFEAAACGVPVLSDFWPGLDSFFEPAAEILIACGCDDVLCALGRDEDELRRIGRRARERVMSQHTARHRARELLTAIEATVSSRTDDRRDHRVASDARPRS